MPIDEKAVRHIARLARMELRAEELEAYRNQLDKILESMEELRALDTDRVSATSHVLGLTDVLRPDQARLFENREALLEGAPEREGPYYKVRKVIE